MKDIKDYIETLLEFRANRFTRKRGCAEEYDQDYILIDFGNHKALFSKKAYSPLDFNGSLRFAVVEHMRLPSKDEAEFIARKAKDIDFVIGQDEDCDSVSIPFWIDLDISPLFATTLSDGKCIGTRKIRKESCRLMKDI